MTRQVILTFFGRTRFFDPTKEEIRDALVAQIDGANADVEAANEANEKAMAAATKATEDIAKKQEVLEKAQATLADATVAVDGSTPDPDDPKPHEKLVKALDKATKGVPKAESAVTKAQEKASAEGEKVSDASKELVAAQARVLEVENQVRMTPRPPVHVTARTEAVDLGELAEHLPESYHHRQETEPHESPLTMTIPLIVLASLAAVAGALNLPFTKDLHFLAHWLEPSLFGHEAKLTAATSTKWVLAFVAIFGGLAAVIGAFRVYRKGAIDPAQIENRTLAHAWYVDETYANFFGGPGRRLFDAMSWFDRTVVDGAVRGIAKTTEAVGSTLKVMQPGFVRSYALGVGVGSIVVMFLFLGRLF